MRFADPTFLLLGTMCLLGGFALAQAQPVPSPDPHFSAQPELAPPAGLPSLSGPGTLSTPNYSGDLTPPSAPLSGDNSSSGSTTRVPVLNDPLPLGSYAAPTDSYAAPTDSYAAPVESYPAPVESYPAANSYPMATPAVDYSASAVASCTGCAPVVCQEAACCAPAPVAAPVASCCDDGMSYGMVGPSLGSGGMSYSGGYAGGHAVYGNAGYGVSSPGYGNSGPGYGNTVGMYYGSGGLHDRYPYFSYRRPWYSPGPVAQNVSIIW